jgi:hypothetical protein
LLLYNEVCPYGIFAVAWVVIFTIGIAGIPTEAFLRVFTAGRDKNQAEGKEGKVFHEVGCLLLILLGGFKVFDLFLRGF